MYSDITDTYIKAKRYAADPERLQKLDAQRFLFKGNHSDHKLILVNGEWRCDCQFFNQWPVVGGCEIVPFCAHTIAAEKQLLPA